VAERRLDLGGGRWFWPRIRLLVTNLARSPERWEVGRMAGTLGLQAGRLELESIVRAPLVVVADPVVAASGPPVTPDELDGAGWALLDRPAGPILAVANPAGQTGLFVWAGRDFAAVLADPDPDPDTPW
jgi:hypothetical protein